MAFSMCQSCDKSCLNFTQSEIKCQQKLLPQLSDQVRQTTNRKKSIKCERCPEGVGTLNSGIPIGLWSIQHVFCQLPLLLVVSAHSQKYIGEWCFASRLGHEWARNSAALAEDAGRLLGMVGSQQME